MFVVASILLALAFDDWNENRGYAELADQSLAIFEQEILQNIARVEDGHPYHQGIRVVLGQMQAQADPSLDALGIMEGLEAPVLLSTAWQTALATGVLTRMDFEVVSALSLTYSIQQSFMERVRSDRPRMVEAEGLGASAALEQVRAASEYVTMLTTDESELLTVFGEALRVIRSHRGHDDPATLPPPTQDASEGAGG